MLTIYVMAIATSLGTAPAGAGAVEIFSYADYPADARAAKRPARIVLELAIADDGRATACQPVSLVGTAEDAGRFCEIAMMRAKSKPATDEEGRAVGGLRLVSGTWFTQGGEMPSSWSAPPDATLTVASLPNGVKTATVTIVRIIAASGQVEKCALTLASGITEIDQNACALISAQIPALPVNDRNARPIRTRRSTRVTLVAP